ncbi:hypothetical protein RHO13_04775 [Orbus wheelerorum]|uniref:hypothetical protein n=1 Tax=Orbus wheelerorum TaxID=3074111 RepID=UPI00370D3E6C
MARITLEQQDEIIEKLSKAEAILECFSIAVDPSAVVKASPKTIQNTVWILSDLVYEANKIALNEAVQND